METAEVENAGHTAEAVLQGVRPSLSKFNNRFSAEVIQKSPYPGYRPRDQSVVAFYKAFDDALKKRMSFVMADRVRRIALKAEEDENNIGVDIRTCKNDGLQ